MDLTAVMQEANLFYTVVNHRITLLKTELACNGWTDLEIENLLGFGSREVMVQYSQPTADKHFGGDIDAYIALSEKYRTAWFESKDVAQRMRKMKRPGKATEAVYAAMKKEYYAALAA